MKKLVIDHSDNSILEKRHSRLGIASVVIGIAVPLLLVLFFVAAMLLGIEKGSIGSYIFMGVVIFAVSAPLLHFVATIFGVIGWLSKKTKNLFPIIGTCLNFLLGLAGILLILFALWQIMKVGSLILH